MKVRELRKYIKDNNLIEEFNNTSGTYISKANKKTLQNFYDKYNKSDNILTIKEIPKIKNHIPDDERLKEIRNNLIDSTPPPPETPQIIENNQIEYEQDEKDLLNEILQEEPVKIETVDNITEEPIEPEYKKDYIFSENEEIKISRYIELYPNLKELAKNNNFNSSEEKLLYIEQYINRSKAGTNLTNYLFMVTSYLESNKIVNDYVKLEGYTQELLKRKVEIEECIEEIKIKYMDEIGDMLDLPPEARLGLLMLETALSVHMKNLAILNIRMEQLKKKI